MGRAGSRFCRLARVRHHSRWAAPTGRPAPYPARPTNPTPPTELTTEPRNRSHTNRIRRHPKTSQGAGFTSSQIYTGNGTPPRCPVSAMKMASPAASGSAPPDPVRALQHTLYRTAKMDAGRRFHALGDKVIRSDVLIRAWFQVYRNQGASGVDRITVDQVKEYGVT